MIGSILVGATLGVLQGMSTAKQGKSILRTGKNIEKIYAGLADNKALFEKSLKEHKETAGKIKKYQEESAELQYKRNQETVKKTLESSLRNVMNQYIVAKENLHEQILENKSKILMSTQNKNVEESSIKHDTLATLESEATRNQRTLNQNQLNSIESVTNEGIEQEYRVGTDYDNALGNIRKAYNQSIGNAELQRNQDISSLNQTIENGVIAGKNVQQQGYNVIADGNSKIASTLWDAGLKAFNAFGGMEVIGSKLSNFFGGQQKSNAFERSLKTVGQWNPLGNREIHYKTNGWSPYQFRNGGNL